MEEHSFFRTRARTIDHLGREQIADCPTAISELWKNAYDAYAKNVQLHIFDGDIPVAAIVDDGHGINVTEFKNKWLTVGTESKTNGFEVDIDDRDGLEFRPKQGQKGIGRLSSAALGPLLLLVSKRKNSKFVAALIDWRLFENPFLYLQDVRIPVREFDQCFELVELVPKLFDILMGNIWGDSDDSSRNIRLSEAWDHFSAQEINAGILQENTTKEKIVNTLISQVFSEKHFSVWPLWNANSVKGTAMFIAEIQDDLLYQLSETPIDSAKDTEKLSRELFFQTLSNFTDPFSSDEEPRIKNFKYLIKTWKKNIPKEILGDSKEFDLGNLEDLEHIIDGSIDENGYFNGRVKVFGEWIDNFTVKPNQAKPIRKDSTVGPFHLRVGTFEMQIGSTSLTDEQHAKFSTQAEKYSGFRVYRDGLRVMPYGRVDSDYFSIEYRRSKNAGRYFWANRRMFGRVAITREKNPNLKDKAGREGLIDNKASKIFREIVEKILTDAADKYLGSKSEIRKPTLESIKEKKALVKAEEDRKKLQSKERLRVKKAIKQNTASLIAHNANLHDLKLTLESRISLNSLDELQALKIKIDHLNEVTQKYSLSPIPQNLGRLEDEYRTYRKHESAARESIRDLTIEINKAISNSTEKTDLEKASEIYRSKLSSINNSITRLSSKGKLMLSEHIGELDKLVKYSREQFKIAGNTVLENLKLENINFEEALNQLDAEQNKIDIENTQRLSPYITALERISEEIDLEGLAIHSLNESLKYREEIVRLHALAQLGITVEIIGHELESLDLRINSGLKLLSNGALTTQQHHLLEDVKNANSALTQKLQFLSPLKLSGEQISQKISGQEIYEFVRSYFQEYFERQEIMLEASLSFKKMYIIDIVSRIYPIFINLVNNAQYWVQNSSISNRTILFDINDKEVIVADNGPGVELDDIDQLFTLFFTRKQRGGRGVGLYLCKQNLQANGHKIRYETQESRKILPGANFAIEFRGMENG